MAFKILNGLDLGNQRIQNVGSPSTGTDAATKTYVDNVAAGLVWKKEVRAASTGNLTIASPGATIDGVTMATNDRFLAKDQSTASQNGIYVWNGAASAATRATDADSGTELRAGVGVMVTEGTVNADKAFIVTSDNANPTIGTDAVTFGPFSAGASYVEGNGIDITGSTVSVQLDSNSGLSLSGSGLKIDTAVVARKVAFNVGNGSNTAITLTHSWNTRDVQVEVYVNTGSYETVLCDVTRGLNDVTLTFATAPASNAYRAVITG